MEHFVGLDGSVKETSICIVDDTGRIVREVKDDKSETGALTGRVQQMLGGIYANSSGMYYPKVYNIEMDPHEDLNVGAIHLWPIVYGTKAIKDYFESLKTYPNPPAGNLTNFTGR